MKKNKKAKESKKTEFSKWLLRQESVLIWITTISLIALAFVCIFNQYFGELPWLAAMVGFPWGAYGVSQAYYYKKAKAENTKDGIKYETVMHDVEEEVCEDDEEITNDESDEEING